MRDPPARGGAGDCPNPPPSPAIPLSEGCASESGADILLATLRIGVTLLRRAEKLLVAALALDATLMPRERRGSVMLAPGTMCAVRVGPAFAAGCSAEEAASSTALPFPLSLEEGAAGSLTARPGCKGVSLLAH